MEELVEQATEALEEAAPKLVEAESAIKELWSRIHSTEKGNPDDVASNLVVTTGQMLTWLEALRRGIG